MLVLVLRAELRGSGGEIVRPVAHSVNLPGHTTEAGGAATPAEVRHTGASEKATETSN